MQILILAPSFAPALKAGGPARSLTNLTREAARQHDVTVVTSDRDHMDSMPFEGLSGKWVHTLGAEVFYLNPRSLKEWRVMLGSLPSRQFDLVVLNSVWNWGFSLLPAALLATGRLTGPAVLMPRGELEPGALVLKGRKKRILRPLVAALYGRVVSAIGVTSESEARNAKVWFPSSRVLMTTNSPDRIEFGVPESPHDVLHVVGLGRIHPTKGLLPLLAGLGRATRPIRIRWFGAIGDAGYWQECTALADQLPSHVSFEYGGEADRDDIPGILHDADLMALLTAGENFGHVIAESLQAGCPVLTTPATPWTETLREGAGHLVEDREDADSVGAALDHWAARGQEDLARSRIAARRGFERFAAAQPPNIIELGLRALAKRESKENARHE